MGVPTGCVPRSAPRCSSITDKLARSQEQDGIDSFTLSRDDCWDLAQEAMKFYWRRISFLSSRNTRLPSKMRVTICRSQILCYQYAEAEEDRQMAEQHTPFVTAHRIQARVLSHLDGEEHKKALGVIRGGIVEIEDYLRRTGRFDQLEECPSSISYASGKRK